MNGNVVSRSLHDAGLAIWFGGTLAGAVGFNGGAATANDPSERIEIASEAWSKWTPVDLGAIAAHLVGGLGVIAGNSKRIVGQHGVAATYTPERGALILSIERCAINPKYSG